MKRRRILLLLALAAVATSVAVFWPRGPKEPLVEGKRITFWINEALNQPVSSPEHEYAIQAMKAAATNAVPFLLHQFTRPRSKLRATLSRWTSAIPVVSLRSEDYDGRVRTAAWGLFMLGPDAAPALPTLAGDLGNEDRGHLAASAMAGIGDRALPWLLNATASTNPVVVVHAIMGLVEMTFESESAVQPLIQLLRHTNSEIRMMTALNLNRVDKRPDLIVPALAAALADPEPEVRSLAAHSLGEMGTNAQAALPALLLLMSSTNDSVASAASNAVLYIDPAALPARRP